MLRTGRVVGLPVTVDSTENIAEKIVREANMGRGGYVCVANVHMVTTATRDERLHQIMEEADIVTADGLPLVWVLRQKGYRFAERVTGTDLTLELCRIAEKDNMSVYFYGGSVETIEKLKTYISQRFPSLNSFFESPPILSQNPKVDMEVVSRIKESGARIVFVGLGCPKQEYWMAAYKPYLSSVSIGVGAVFDFLSGTCQRAPVWMQRLGLEWFHRLATQPGRTWKRYAITNPVFVWLVLKEWLKL
ncbi:MAG: WecB/TagA/CpsF family glycosyltransferase [Proteobacteria bacterium]|nr:WecB/TagA/CpsF family glycosyltransferase [Pseudomonadota bacterium]